MKLPNTKLWQLNDHSDQMSLQERKDGHLLIVFLNTYNDIETALKYIRRDWLSLVYPLPSTKDIKPYNVVKSSRSHTMKRLKRIYKDYLIQVA